MHFAHPWHGLSYGDAPDIVEAFIEVPMDSMLKYELDKESGHLRLDRVLYSAVHYPGDYGFIPQTLSEDGDPIDIIVLSHNPVHPGVIVQARPIGMLEMVDVDERDEKIIAVHANDPRYDNYKDIAHVNEHILQEIRHFFETYKQLQSNNKVEIKSVKGVTHAKEEIMLAIKRYKEEYVVEE